MGRRRSRGMNLDIKAVENNGGVYGITRFSVTKKEQDSLPVELQGMCVFFEMNPQKIYVHEKSLFYYGHYEDLSANYQASVKIRNIDDYKVDPLPPKGDPVMKKVDRETYFLIPLSEMGYSMPSASEKKRFQLAQESGRKTKESLQILLTKLLLEEVTERTLGFNSAFIRFPKQFGEQARRNGAYYKLDSSQSANGASPLFPDLHLAEKPFGYLPPWAITLVERTKIE